MWCLCGGFFAVYGSLYIFMEVAAGDLHDAAGACTARRMGEGPNVREWMLQIAHGAYFFPAAAAAGPRGCSSRVGNCLSLPACPAGLAFVSPLPLPSPFVLALTRHEHCLLRLSILPFSWSCPS